MQNELELSNKELLTVMKMKAIHKQSDAAAATKGKQGAVVLGVSDPLD